MTYSRANRTLLYAIQAIPPEVWLQPPAPTKDSIKSHIKDLAEEPAAMLHEADYELEGDAVAVPKSRREPERKIEQATIVKSIGQRMRQAREMCNLSQIEAARRFGYSNPSKLSKIEGATDTNSVPLWIIARAAQMYEVSIDFLFGASDDWETGARMTQERAVSAWLFGEFDRQQKMGMRTLYSLNDQLEVLADILPGSHGAALEVGRALDRYRQLNWAAYEDMRGGAKLESAIDALIKRTTAGADAYRRFQGHLQNMKAATSEAANG